MKYNQFVYNKIYIIIGYGYEQINKQINVRIKIRNPSSIFIGKAS